MDADARQSLPSALTDKWGEVVEQCDPAPKGALRRVQVSQQHSAEPSPALGLRTDQGSVLGENDMCFEG